MSKNVKSILTSAMQFADAREEEGNPVTEEEMATYLKTASRKRLVKKVAIATLAGVAISIIAAKLTSSSDEDTTETTED